MWAGTPGKAAANGVGFMRDLAARVLLAFVMSFVAAGGARAAAVPLDYEREVRSITADLDFFAGRFLAFAEGATVPLLFGRSLPVPMPACEPRAEPRRFGLLIAASDPGPRQLRVGAAINDADLLTSMLTSVGADASDIHALTGTRATREGIIDAAWNILSNLRCGDKVFIYFGGYALLQGDIESFQAGERHAGPNGRSLETAIADARKVLQRKVYRDDVVDLLLAMRSSMELLEWYRGSGLTLLLNGEGEIAGRSSAPELTGFEVMTSADISELVTVLRNNRADITVVFDTNHASDAGLFERQQAQASGFWASDILDLSQEAIQSFDARWRPTRLVDSPGELAVFYSSVDLGNSVSAKFEVEGADVYYGLFTFRLAQALLDGVDATVAQVRDALDRIVKASEQQHRVQTHRVESTRADMRVFGRAENPRQRTDTIRILEPSGMRGASVMEKQVVELVGAVDWTSPAKAVLVEGQPARLAPDGRFSATVNLRNGVNTISVFALTTDDEVHILPPLEVVFDGDLKKLKGEGRRFAVIIANQNYLPETRFSRLQTPIADAEALRDILATRYGFATELPVGGGEAMPLLLVDASRDQIDETLYTLSQVAGEQDTVLIYYAGHGVYDERTTNAYWVPVNATRPYNYLSGDGITEHIQRIAARSVILISDSCYSGALRAGGEAPPPLGEVTEQDRQRALLRMAEGRSRILITSGGTEPVMDTGGGGHSIFARALLTGLEKMDGGAFSAEELFRDYIRPMVSGRAEQMPQFKPIEKTGHEPAADVVFVRVEGPQTMELR